MGESRPSSMRASGMEDVIFAGVEGRSPRNFAEVTLEIDNSEQKLQANSTDTKKLRYRERLQEK